MRGKSAIILYGPPGSGKGTQAILLEDNLGFYHFDTGRYLRQALYDSKNKNNKEIQNERKLNESGKLNSPKWVLKIVSQKTKDLSKTGHSIVFSGSPRTIFETFGSKKQKGLIDLLIKEFGKNNIFIFLLKIPEQETIRRNSNRRICSVCGVPLLSSICINPRSNPYKSATRCPFCGGKILKRKDDDKNTITKRLREFKERTLPIINELKKKKNRVIEIDGTPPPYKIHQKIISYL